MKSAGVGCYNGLNGSYTCPGNCLGLWGLKISGTIPNNAGQMTGLNYLGLGANKISGTVPDAIGQLTKLTELGLGANKISGTVPDSFGQMTELNTLGLGANKFSGTVPDVIGQLMKLQILDLSDNEISGTVPHTFGQLTKLQFLCVSLRLSPPPRTSRYAAPQPLAPEVRAPRFIRALHGEVHARRSLTALSLPLPSFRALTFAGT